MITNAIIVESIIVLKKRKILCQILYSMSIILYFRRIYTEEKTKVVTAAWRTELIPFLAKLAICYLI